MAENETMITREMAADGKVVSYGGYDTVNKLVRTKGWEYLDSVAKDTHVSSVLRTRRQKLLRNPWDIIPASEGKEDRQIADFVKWNLQNLSGSFEDDLESMLGGVFYGYSLAEKNWMITESGKYAGKAVLRSIRNKPVRYWKFKQDEFGNVFGIVARNPIFKNNGPFSPLKFVHITWGLDDEDPYGDPSAAKVAFWQWLKSNGAQFWAVFLERFGMPSLVVTVPPDLKESEKLSVDEFLSAYQSSTGMRVPDGIKVTLLEATRSGSADYDNFIERCNKEISKEILGVTLAIEEGKRGQGSYALGNVHSDVLDDYTHFDAVKISVAVTNQVIKELVDYNFDVTDYPAFVFPKAINSSVLAQNLETYAKAGMKIPLWWLHKEFGIPLPKDGESVLVPGTTSSRPQGAGISNTSMTAFAEDANVNLDNIESYYAHAGSSAVADIFAKVKGSLEKKLTEKIRVDQLPNFSVNVGTLQDSISRMIVSAHLYGMMIAKKKIEDAENFADTVVTDPYEYFISRNVLNKKQFQILEEAARKRAFTIAGLARADIEKIFGEIGLTLKNGWTWEEFRTAVDQHMITYTGTAWAAATAAVLEDVPLDTGHLRLVYRNALMQSYTDGQIAYMNDPDVEDTIWGYRYIATGDDRTREDHQALDGTTLPKTHTFWNKYMPPWDHNCRCDIVPVTFDEIAKGSEKMKEPPYYPTGGF